MPDNIVGRDGNGAITIVKTTERNGVHTPFHTSQNVSKRFYDGFEDTAVDPAKWDIVTSAGTSVTESGGNLSLVSGTTANAVCSVTSKEIFTLPVKLSVGLALSQRIVNQTFWVELVSCNPTTGVVDEANTASWFFDATTTTQGRYRVRSQNGTPLDSSVVTVVSTATTAVFDIEPGTMDTWFHTEVLDSNSTRSNSYRRHQKAMDPDCYFKIRLRWVNGTTAPASSTTASVAFVRCIDHTDLTAEISSISLGQGAGQSMPVTVVGGGLSASNTDNIWFQESVTAQTANATVTGVARDVGVTAGNAHRFSYFRAFVIADQAGTLRLEVSNDNTTWRRASVDTAVAANVPTIVGIPIVARFFRAVLVNGASAQTFLLFNTAVTAS